MDGLTAAFVSITNWEEYKSTKILDIVPMNKMPFYFNQNAIFAKK